MIYRILGKTGLKVSVIGYGTSPLGAEFGVIDPTEGKRAVDHAVDNGINYFDAAPYYGRTLAEKRLGEFLTGKRQKVILASKACRYDITTFDFSAKRVRESIEESLKRLRTDYLDVYQIHDVEYCELERIINETIPAMLKLKKQGKIRFVGITGYPLTNLKKIAEAADIDTILTYCHYTLIDTSMDDILTPIVKQKEIGLINAAPLHMGALTEKGAPSWHPAPEQVLAAAKRAAAFCKKKGTKISELAMQFALQHPDVATTVTGMTKQHHVDTNINLVGKKPDAELLQEVLEIFKPVANIRWKEGLPENDDPDAVDKRTLGLERNDEIRKA